MANLPPSLEGLKWAVGNCFMQLQVVRRHAGGPPELLNDIKVALEGISQQVDVLCLDWQRRNLGN